MEVIKAMDEFIQLYVEDSAIETIEYNNKTKKWIVKYNYDVPDDEFNTVKDMVDFFDSDQFGGE